MSILKSAAKTHVRLERKCGRASTYRNFTMENDMSFDLELARVSGTDYIDPDGLYLPQESEGPNEISEAEKTLRAARETHRIATVKSAIELGNFSYSATIAIGEDGDLEMIEGRFSGGEAGRVELYDHHYQDKDIKQGTVWADEEFSPQQLENCLVDLLTINSEGFYTDYAPRDSQTDGGLTPAQGDSICNKICHAIKSRSIENSALPQLGTTHL